MNLMESLMAQGFSSSSGGSNLTPEVKEALLDCFANVAWANDDGQQYYDALEDALYGLQSISAVYTQSGTVYDTDSLDSLKADLVVTATYGDGSTQTVPAESYTLSGTLTDGTSTITVSYGGKTTTFDVVVTGPLYSVPDFAEKSATVSGNPFYVSKSGDVYTFRTKGAGVVYLYPDGTLSSDKSDTLWFQTTQGKKLENRTINIEWVNPTSVGAALNVKFARSDATGNLYTSAFDMAANGSGSGGYAEYVSESLASSQNVSCIALQYVRASGSGAYPSEITASFKIRLFVDGVRYL